MTLVGSKLVRDFTAAELKEGGTEQSRGTACSTDYCHHHPFPSSLGQGEESSISLNPACASETLRTAEGLQVPEEDKKGSRHLVELKRREGKKSTREGMEVHKKVQKCQTQIKLQITNTFLSFARRIQKPFQGL